MFQLFLNAFIILLVITDPIVSAIAFVGLTSGYKRKKILSSAIKAIIVSFGLMLFFAFFGSSLIEMLGISLPAFRIAGGLLLFITSVRMLFGPDELTAVPDKKLEVYDIAIFPIAIPLIAGPGCITAIILLMSKATTVGEGAMVLAAILANCVIVFGCLLTAGTVKKLFGKSGIIVISRITGVLLAALSIQFVVDGIRSILI